MPVNWTTTKAFERLLAATVAANDMKLNYNKIAAIYGEGATYHSIEGRFRIVKRDAAKLLAESSSSSSSSSAPRNKSTTASSSSSSFSNAPNNKVSAPKKPRAKVITGRVTKMESPVKKGKKVNSGADCIKEEEDEEEEGTALLYGGGMDVDGEVVAEGLGLSGGFQFGGEDEEAGMEA